MLENKIKLQHNNFTGMTPTIKILVNQIDHSQTFKRCVATKDRNKKP